MHSEKDTDIYLDERARREKSIMFAELILMDKRKTLIGSSASGRGHISGCVVRPVNNSIDWNQNI